MIHVRGAGQGGKKEKQFLFYASKKVRKKERGFSQSLVLRFVFPIS